MLFKHGDFGILHLVVLAHNIYEALVLDGIGCLLRNNDSLAATYGELEDAGSSGTEQLVGVGKGGTHLQASGCGVDDTAEAGHLAEFAIDAAVGKDEGHLRQTHTCGLTASVFTDELEELLFGHGKIGVHLLEVAHSGKRLCDACADE